MPDIFDRLGSFFKSIFNEEENQSAETRQYYDDDMQDAWNELEDYLNEGKSGSQPKSGNKERPQGHARPAPDVGRETLRADYANLKVPFGTSFEIVKTSYKKLLRQYHPDKHASDAEKFKLATEITSKLNQSFQRIEEYERKRNA
jgi:DnaJ-domain-containing protein 1